MDTLPLSQVSSFAEPVPLVAQTDSPPPLSFEKLVEAAILAPSPDNNQPWHFVGAGRKLTISLDPARALPSDVNAMFDLVGLGAAIENICIAARQSGWTPAVDYNCAPLTAIQAGAAPAAEIAFTPAGQPDSLFSQLDARCSRRRLYATRSVPADKLAQLAAATRVFPDVQVDWLTARSQLHAFAKLLAVSDRLRFEYEPFHSEIFRQLRFSAAEAECTRDGLDIRTLELPPGAAFLLRQLRPWSRMRWLQRLHLTGLLTLPSVLSVWRSGVLGVLSLPEPAAHHWLQGGRAFQRLWLAAQAQQLSLQPLGSLPIFMAHHEQLAGRKLNSRHQCQARELIDRFHNLVPSTNQRTLLMVFRLGYAKPPRVRSLRRPASAVATYLAP